MSLLQLSNTQDCEWYLPRGSAYPYGKKGYKTKQFSPREKTIRKCKEIAFYSTELPIIQHHKYNMWKYFDKSYVYSQIIDIVMQKNPKDVLYKNSIRRTKPLL